ncbi:MAG: short-subunit dehydrogenase [Candidatus Binatia bacterium]|jgi:short-subunit dehydrogenase
MKLDSSKTVLLTGATGGLGVYLARELAKFGVNQALIAFPGVELPPLQKEMENTGIKAFYLVADLRERKERERVFEEVRKEFGRIDILINNAGVEFTAPYDVLSEDEIATVLSVNLEAPMMLSRLVIPEMLERRCGHIVNMSSLAGKSGPAYQEPYAATKAALIGFTTSLRATYRGTGVSASVICPGFVEAGIYARAKESAGCPAPAVLGTIRPEAVARAVVRAIQKDKPQVIVNKWPVRPLFAMAELFPSFGAWLTRFTGAHKFFKRVYEAQRKPKPKVDE